MSDETFVLPKGAYNVAIGALGVIHSDTNIAWLTCRDQFHGELENHASVMTFLFSHTGKQDNVIAFLRMIESICRVPLDQELKFRETTNPQVIHITLSQWWRYRLRRSLLTALCRCSQAYTEHNGAGFEKALWSQSYTNSTKLAVNAFLDGKTMSKMKRKQNFTGWQSLFYGNRTETVDFILAKMKRRKKPMADSKRIEKERLFGIINNKT